MSLLIDIELHREATKKYGIYIYLFKTMDACMHAPSAGMKPFSSDFLLAVRNSYVSLGSNIVEIYLFLLIM